MLNMVELIIVLPAFDNAPRISDSDLRQGDSYSDDFSLMVLTKFCTSNSNSKIF